MKEKSGGKAEATELSKYSSREERAASREPREARSEDGRRKKETGSGRTYDIQAKPCD
jgi:hypothetical protein